jgi:hypothetical protein
LAMGYVSPPRRVDPAALRQGLGGGPDQPLGLAEGAARLDGAGHHRQAAEHEALKKSAP